MWGLWVPGPHAHSHDTAVPLRAAGGRLYVHGGQNNLLLEDLFVLDLRAREWAEIVLPGAGPAPTPRHSHCLAVAGGRLLLFGGYDELGPAERRVHCLQLGQDGRPHPRWCFSMRKPDAEGTQGSRSQAASCSNALLGSDLPWCSPAGPAGRRWTPGWRPTTTAAPALMRACSACWRCPCQSLPECRDPVRAAALVGSAATMPCAAMQSAHPVPAEGQEASPAFWDVYKRGAVLDFPVGSARGCRQCVHACHEEPLLSWAGRACR